LLGGNAAWLKVRKDLRGALDEAIKAAGAVSLTPGSDKAPPEKSFVAQLTR
jgi:hypothetical protein